MSPLIYQNFLTSNTLPTPSTHYSSSDTSLPMMRCFQQENWTNLTQLKVTDSKLNKYYNSDSNLEPGNDDMKLNGKVMKTKAIAGCMQMILMSSLQQTTGFIVTSHIPTSLEYQAHPHKQDSKGKKYSDKSMKKD